jgi:probable phosphoglycerate mutase
MPLLEPSVAGEPRVTRVLVIRHGETDWNVAARIQGLTDIPLNALGRQQAARLARALADETLHAVYTSDLQRARDTAAALAQACGAPLREDTGLRERHFGHFEGATFEEIAQRWPEDALRWRQRDPDFGPTGGEALQAFFDRSVAAAYRLAAAHAGQTIALVAHGGVLDCLYRAATRLELQAPRTWQVGNATVNRLLWTPEGFTLVGWNDTTHLEAEDAPDALNGVSA